MIVSNALHNLIAKIIDYGEEEKGKDYWKTPLETLSDLNGDCEDLAILAYFMAKKIFNINPNFLKLHHVITENGENHVILSIYEIEFGTWVVIDNNSEIPYLYDSLPYKEIYYFNEYGIRVKNYFLENRFPGKFKRVLPYLE